MNSLYSIQEVITEHNTGLEAFYAYNIPNIFQSP